MTPTSNMTSTVRKAAITMPTGLVLLVGGAIAIATGATAVGAVLLVLAIATVGVGLVLMLTVRKRAQALSRDLQEQLRDSREHRLP
jgi:Flp pilus assembly protein TadB